MQYFNPRSPCGERLSFPIGLFGNIGGFQSTLPVWGATRSCTEDVEPLSEFQSTLPVWGATCREFKAKFGTRFQSTLPVWGATPSLSVQSRIWRISIHAPRVGSDPGRLLSLSRQYSISIHAPRVGSDVSLSSLLRPEDGFQSTLPVWGATRKDLMCLFLFLRFQSTLPVWGATPAAMFFRNLKGISIHAPRVGSDALPSLSDSWIRISIHAPRVGSDFLPVIQDNFVADFNPRSPCGERRGKDHAFLKQINFNPRSPCGERQSGHPTDSGGRKDFNPRSPCGERPRRALQHAVTSAFQSTLPVWGATAMFQLPCRHTGISIHAPRVGSDPSGIDPAIYNPISIHAPRVGSDPPTFSPIQPPMLISIHAPRVGSDSLAMIIPTSRDSFQSTLPVWGATSRPTRIGPRYLFQSTLPVWGAT